MDPSQKNDVESDVAEGGGIFFGQDATWIEQSDKRSGIRVFHSVGQESLIETSVRIFIPNYDMAAVTNGNRFGFKGEIDGQPFAIGPHSGNRITLVPAGLVLSGIYRMGSAPSTMILFPKGRLQGMLPRDAAAIQPLAMIIDDVLAEILRNIEALVLAKSSEHQNQIEDLTRDLADQLHKRSLIAQDDTTSLGMSPFNLRRVMAHIDENLAQPMTNDDLAALVGLSTFHFLRVFKQATGHTPRRHIVLRRLATAQTLIATTDLPIAAIAAQCGFASPAHLATTFRLHLGVSPMQYGANVRAGLTKAPTLKLDD